MEIRTDNSAVIAALNERIAELEETLIMVRDVLNDQEDKSCLGLSTWDNTSAPWPIVDEVINGITRALKADKS